MTAMSRFNVTCREMLYSNAFADDDAKCHTDASKTVDKSTRVKCCAMRREEGLSG